MTGPPSDRTDVVDRIADHLCALRPGHPLRVAVDGITGAGKTTLAGELAEAVSARGRVAIHLSCDGFHHRRAYRHRRGRGSALGYYQDAYDTAALVDAVLRPLGPEGDHRFVTRIHDLQTDDVVCEAPRQAPPDAVLLVDGTFLQRPELAGWWDEVVYVRTSFEHARARGVLRDATLLGGPEAAGTAFDQRYHAACRMYLDDVDPARRAGVILDNDDLEHPVLQRIQHVRRIRDGQRTQDRR